MKRKELQIIEGKSEITKFIFNEYTDNSVALYSKEIKNFSNNQSAIGLFSTKNGLFSFYTKISADLEKDSSYFEYVLYNSKDLNSIKKYFKDETNKAYENYKLDVIDEDEFFKLQSKYDLLLMNLIQIHKNIEYNQAQLN